MSRSYEYPPREQQYHGWGTTSHDYHDHIARMQRMPSVIPEAPKYPNVHKAFNNTYTYEEEEPRPHYEEEHHMYQQHQQRRSPKKVVHMSEKVETIECDRNGNCQVVEESVDMDAAGFIQQRHKGFEICKWKTFKMH